MDCDFLKFFFLNNGIDGDFYNLIKFIYGNIVLCVRVSELCIDWFFILVGVW